MVTPRKMTYEVSETPEQDFADILQDKELEHVTAENNAGRVPSLRTYKSKDVAAMLQVSPQTLLRYVREGRVKATKVGTIGGKGGRYLFTEEEVRRVLNGGEATEAE